MKILDLGAGCSKYRSEGDTVIGLDKEEGIGIDVVWDLEKTPLPFGDNEFDMVIASHVLEDVSVGFLSLMEELRRIMKPDAVLKVWVPNGSSMKSNNNPYHSRHFGIGSFRMDGFTTEKREFRFTFTHQPVRWTWLNILNPILNLWQGFIEKFLPFVPDELYFELRCEK